MLPISGKPEIGAGVLFFCAQARANHLTHRAADGSLASA